MPLYQTRFAGTSDDFVRPMHWHDAAEFDLGFDGIVRGIIAEHRPFPIRIGDRWPHSKSSSLGRWPRPSRCSTMTIPQSARSAAAPPWMLMMKSQLFKPVRLVSLRRLEPGWNGISLSEDGSHFRIGAMTTFTDLELSPEIGARLPVIPQTMKTLANVRVRNVATIGGNLAHADPHLDLPPVWTALGAKVVILSPGGERTVPVEELFAGYYETTLGHDDLIAEIHVPVCPSWTSTYVKVTTRAAHDWPALSIAVSAELEGKQVRDIRIVLSAAIDKPTRLDSGRRRVAGRGDRRACARARRRGSGRRRGRHRERQSRLVGVQSTVAPGPSRARHSNPSSGE